MSAYLKTTWVRLLLSNVPFLLALNAARMADAAEKSTALTTYMFWFLVLLFNVALWVRLTWELVFQPKNSEVHRCGNL